jgi:ADP-heptose:LPS heptosyltransferase
MSNGILLKRQTKPYKVYCRLHKSPGDILVFTAAIRSLKLLYPDMQVCVETTCPELWQGNPDVTKLIAGFCHIVEMHSHLHKPRRTFIEAYCSHLSASLGIPVTQQVSTPVLNLSEAEKGLRLVKEGKPYLVLAAGGKTDLTIKQPGQGFMQSVVSRLNRKYRLVQVGAASDEHHSLTGVTNLVGKTSLRELATVVYHSAGGFGGVTLLQHLCAALGKPYVCVAGGREDRGWTDYPNQVTLSAIGQLPCCEQRGCWLSRTVAIPDDDYILNSKLCTLPVVDKWGDTVPSCLNLFSPQDVVDALHQLESSALHISRIS